MTRSERRLFRDTVIIGVCLTVIAFALDLGDAFVAPERFFYDFRARHCQFWNTAPSDKLVHLEIDDPSLELIGRWPWPRARLAEMVDELRMAGAKTLAMDVIFAEPSDLGYEEIDPGLPVPLPPPADPGPLAKETPGPQPATLVMASLLAPSTAPSVAPDVAPETRPTSRPSTKPAAPEVVRAIRVDNDAVFAESLKRFGKVVVPVALNLSNAPPEMGSYKRMVEILETDPEFVGDGSQDVLREAMLRRLREEKYEEPNLIANVDRYLGSAAEEAMFRRIEREMSFTALDFDQLRARILPHVDPTLATSALLNRLNKQYERYLAIKALREFARKSDARIPLLGAYGEQATLREFTSSAALTGFVDYIPMADGIVRAVPLLAEHRGYVFPQIGLSMACVMLDVDIHQVRITPDAIILPLPDGTTIDIPTRYNTNQRGTFTAFFDIPWFGEAGLNAWRNMYDFPDHQKPKQLMSMVRVWEPSLIKRQIQRNNREARKALALLAIGPYKDDFKGLADNLDLASLDDPDAFTPRIDRVLKYVADNGFTELFQTVRPDDDEETRAMVLSYLAVRQVRAQNAGHKDDLIRKRANLRRDLEGKACLLGYTAVGAIADTIPTSLHPRCPGVAVHGVIFNSILTRDFWRSRHLAIRISFVVIIGLMTTAVVATLPAWKAMVASILIVTAYFLFNGLYLFDYGNQVIPVSGPVFAGVAVWAGGTLSRYILESAERRRVTARFSSYADKALVDYVLNNPQEKLDGKREELTVVFTDLQGFTTISEALKEATVPLLNEYMGLMVPLIKKQNGYINKFLGDGIMYFFGAPLPNPKHAYNAVASVLEMQEAMVPFNASLKQRELPTLILRAGITTGDMVVGDAGPPERSDYTVIGDNVNLSARLEGANKAVGTRILINDRCREMIGDAFLCRPIAKLKVKGKLQGVMTFEAMAFPEKATDEQRELAKISADVVHPFCERAFEECLKVLDVMEATYGISKFTYIYREQCQKFLQEPPPPGWAGEIELTEK